MKINTDEITSIIKQEVANYDTQLDVSQVGTVVEVGDGIARIYGCLLYTSPSPRDQRGSRMPSSA